MGFDDLKAEISQYHLQIEEVLSGMDGALTDIVTRVEKLEEDSLRRTGYEQQIRMLGSKLEELQEQVTALGRLAVELANGR
jgi:hypothetical protein